MAFVVPVPGHAPTPEAIIAWCREHMANYKVPRRVEIVDALPLNASGKVTKFVLRERARGRSRAARDRRARPLGAGRGARRGDARRAASRSTSASARSTSPATATPRCAPPPGCARAGVGAETRVSWMLPTRLEALVLCAALARLGAVQNPILPIYREREVRFIARQTGARLLCVPGVVARLRLRRDGARARRASSRGLDVLVVDGALPEGDPARAARPRRRRRRRGARRCAGIFYTSGTTADPEGRAPHRRDAARELPRAGARARAGARRPPRARVPVHARRRHRLAARRAARRLRARRRGGLRPEDDDPAARAPRRHAGRRGHRVPPGLPGRAARSSPARRCSRACARCRAAARRSRRSSTTSASSELGGVGHRVGLRAHRVPDHRDEPRARPRREARAHRGPRESARRARSASCSPTAAPARAGRGGRAARARARSCVRGYLDAALDAEAFDARRLLPHRRPRPRSTPTATS